MQSQRCVQQGAGQKLTELTNEREIKKRQINKQMQTYKNVKGRILEAELRIGGEEEEESRKIHF